MDLEEKESQSANTMKGQMELLRILNGDAATQLATLPDRSVQCCVTSPPYWGLRDYGHTGQLGLEKTPEEYISKLAAVFREVRRVLKSDGMLWLNLGDSYAGSGRGIWNIPDEEKSARGVKETYRPSVDPRRADRTPTKEHPTLPPGLKPKDLVGIPWMVAFALRSDGWWLRQDIIWSKPNPMPESVTDRCTKAHEYLFMLSKSARYYYDAEAIQEPAIYCGLTGQDESGFKNVAEFNGKHGEAAKNGNQRRDKQRGHSRRHAGFNDRWDGMDRKEQCGAFRNKRSVWEIATRPYPDAHFATYPPALIAPCILAGSKPGDTILDPFAGSGTTGMVAIKLGRKALLIELNPEYVTLIKKRCAVTPGLQFA